VAINSAWLPTGDIQSWGNNSIRFIIPYGTLPGALTVTSNGFTSNWEFLNLPFGSDKVYLPLLLKKRNVK
jgi:hypothetical protein